jgi:riboflavin-specific deaminase-like protein
MRDLIESFLINCNPTNDPTIILSWAQSIDGFLSLKEGQASAISCPETLVLTHIIRSLCQGILVGINTIITDDPILTCRLEGNPSSPIPVILDSTLRIPLNSRILERSPIICTTKKADPIAKDLLEKRGAQIEVIDENSTGSIDLHRYDIFYGLILGCCRYLNPNMGLII